VSAKPFPFILLALSIGLMVGGCGRSDDAATIRNMIVQAADLAEKHDIADLMAMTADGFRASPGDHDASGVRGILFVAFKHYGSFTIRYPRPSVEVDSNAGTAKATVYFMIVSRGRPMPEFKELYENPQQWLEQAGEKADLYQLKLELVGSKEAWRVQKADLAPFKGLGF
jgi:hypothetical protein